MLQLQFPIIFAISCFTRIFCNTDERCYSNIPITFPQNVSATLHISLANGHNTSNNEMALIEHAIQLDIAGIIDSARNSSIFTGEKNRAVIPSSGKPFNLQPQMCRRDNPCCFDSR